ncbi:MAG: class I SAM-dependent methyltransferase [Elusimicrobiota bacterium]
MENNSVESKTGNLFGNLFSAYDQENYLRSVNLFKQRFEDNGFNINYFRGKKCLDLGCGGGRYSIALSMLGASEVVGVDISKVGIEDAKKRAYELKVDNVQFIQNTAEELPFFDGYFDCIIFSGVLMHMENPEKGISETSRVLKSGGVIYMLVYATGGLRWPLINILRNFSHEIGFKTFDQILTNSGELDVNKRRTYLDDLFVPLIDFYTEERLIKLLHSYGYEKIERWQKGRLDHEESIESYCDDLNKLTKLYQLGASMQDKLPSEVHALFVGGAEICNACTAFAQMLVESVKQGTWSEAQARKMIIGQGHHRISAIKK